jgi:hypothetical protein
VPRLPAAADQRVDVGAERISGLDAALAARLDAGGAG